MRETAGAWVLMSIGSDSSDSRVYQDCGPIAHHRGEEVGRAEGDGVFRT